MQKNKLAFTVKKVYNVQHKLNLVNNNTSGADIMQATQTTPVFAQLVTATSKANSKLVQCVGVSDHAKLGYKIRFSGKPEATSRVSTLIATKLHSDIRFINLAHATTEVEAAVVLEAHPGFADENAQAAIAAFLSKYNATDVQAARDAYAALLEQAA